MKIELDPDQLAAVDILNSSNFVLFTGGPGTGKTTTLAHWLKSLDDLSGTWCFAPTGRAAQRMEEAFAECGLNLKASTIHAGLIPNRMGHDGGGWTFCYNEFNQLPCVRVVVDESSMIDTSLMASLLQAIPNEAQVILVGDPNQLPPVGKGRPFLDMIQSAKIPTANLTKPHRFAGRLAHVCQGINKGMMVIASERLDLSTTAGVFGPENIRHVERKTTTMQLATLDVLIPKMEAHGFDPRNDMQTIVPRNSEGGVSREAVNKRLQQLLNPDGASLDDCPFRISDKIMCLQNGTRETWTIDSPFEPGFKNGGEAAYIANGEMGEVVCITSKAIFCRFPSSTGVSAVQFTKATWKSQVTLAYAITSHKSQGGGWPVVFYMIDDTRLNDRSLVYTAISRAKKVCITIGTMALLTKQIFKQSVTARKTFLQEAIQEMVPT